MKNNFLFLIINSVIYGLFPLSDILLRIIWVNEQGVLFSTSLSISYLLIPSVLHLSFSFSNLPFLRNSYEDKRYHNCRSGGIYKRVDATSRR